MRINKRLRKAFTLVELVVVIAIIAILSTVSVVTYFGITSSAKKSVDDQTITQWNQLLLLEEELGNKSETPQEALDIILENGWDVAKLTPTYEGNEILWDQEENRFLILDKDTVTNSRVRNAYESSRKGEYWRFLKDYSEPKGYSVYITDPEFKVSETLIVTAGIDLSRVTEKVDVKYENVSKDQKVILNTNGGTLEVSDANVEVKHFGTASKSTVSSKSYEEKGTIVGDTLVNGGKYIATSSEAEAGTVLVSSKDVELNISASAKVGTVAGTTDEAQAAIKSNTNIPSDKKLDSDTAVVPTTDFAGGLGTENSPYIIDNENQYLNIKLFEKEMETKPYYFTLNNNIDLSKVNVGRCVSNTFNGKLNGNGYKVVVNPSQYYMFNFSVDNVVIENLTWVLNGTNALVFFNRYGTIASSYDKSSQKYTTITSQINLTFNNIKIEGQNNNFYSFNTKNCGLLTYCQSYVEILNAKDVGGTPDSNKNSYYAYTSETTNCITNTIVNNCEVTANLSSNTYNSVLLGGQTESINKINVSNFNYSGTFIGKQIGLVFANANDSLSGLSLINFNNVELIGSLIYTQESNSMAGITFANNRLELDGAKNNGTISQIIKDNKLSLNVVDSKYVLTEAENNNVEKYVISLSLSALKFTDETYTADLGEASINTLTFTINPGEQNLYKSKNITKRQALEKGLILSENWISSNEGTKCQFVNNNGEWYLVIDYESSGYYREFKNTDTYCTASVYAYDNTGRILHISEE